MRSSLPSSLSNSLQAGGCRLIELYSSHTVRRRSVARAACWRVLQAQRVVDRPSPAARPRAWRAGAPGARWRGAPETRPGARDAGAPAAVDFLNAAGRAGRRVNLILEEVVDERYELLVERARHLLLARVPRLVQARLQRVPVVACRALYAPAVQLVAAYAQWVL